MQDRIINLVGASGTGKTTIAKHLKGKGFNIIKSYTTRKPRRENEWGHIFIRGNWEVVDLFCAIDRRGNDIEIPKGNMIAYKNLYRDHYFATKEQYQGKGTSIYIVDPDGAEQVKRDVDDAEVITIALNADKENRMHRIRGRLTKQYLGDMTTVRE